jgi:hypothetical protein
MSTKTNTKKSTKKDTKKDTKVVEEKKEEVLEVVPEVKTEVKEKKVKAVKTTKTKANKSVEEVVAVKEAEPVVEVKTVDKKVKEVKEKKAKKVEEKVEEKVDEEKVKLVREPRNREPKAKKAKKTKDVGVDQVDTGEEEEKSDTRYFRVIYEGQEPRGRFSGSKPKQAANKASTSIFKVKKKNSEPLDVKISFCIVECTRGSKNKKFFYTGEKVQLEVPLKVTINKGGVNKKGEAAEEKDIFYKSNNRVMKDKNPVDNVVIGA